MANRIVTPRAAFWRSVGTMLWLPLQRYPAGGDRRAGGTPRPLDHAFAPWKADSSDLGRTQVTAADARDVLGGMGVAKLLGAGRHGAVEVRVGKLPGGAQALAQARILFHREAMARRQRQNESVGIEEFHARHGRVSRQL